MFNNFEQSVNKRIELPHIVCIYFEIPSWLLSLLKSSLKKSETPFSIPQFNYYAILGRHKNYSLRFTVGSDLYRKITAVYSIESRSERNHIAADAIDAPC